MGLPAKELTCLRRSGGSNPLVSAHFHFGGSVSPGLVELAPVAQRIEHLTTDQKVGGSNPSGRTSKTPAHRICGLGFFVLAVRWRPFSRLLELKNTKTAGRDFFAEMPTLGFRILGFVFSDSSWRTPHPHSNIAGG